MALRATASRALPYPRREELVLYFCLVPGDKVLAWTGQPQGVIVLHRVQAREEIGDVADEFIV